jgi:hypothetical protein
MRPRGWVAGLSTSVMLVSHGSSPVTTFTDPERDEGAVASICHVMPGSVSSVSNDDPPLWFPRYDDVWCSPTPLATRCHCGTGRPASSTARTNSRRVWHVTTTSRSPVLAIVGGRPRSVGPPMTDASTT